jgi:hypothetical protein
VQGARDGHGTNSDVPRDVAEGHRFARDWRLDWGIRWTGLRRFQSVLG